MSAETTRSSPAGFVIVARPLRRASPAVRPCDTISTAPFLAETSIAPAIAKPESPPGAGRPASAKTSRASLPCKTARPSNTATPVSGIVTTPLIVASRPSDLMPINAALRSASLPDRAIVTSKGRTAIPSNFARETCIRLSAVPMSGGLSTRLMLLVAVRHDLKPPSNSPRPITRAPLMVPSNVTSVAVLERAPNLTSPAILAAFQAALRSKGTIFDTAKSSVASLTASRVGASNS